MNLVVIGNGMVGARVVEEILSRGGGNGSSSAGRNPCHSKLPSPGTGSSPFQPLRTGVSPATFQPMLPSTSA